MAKDIKEAKKRSVDNLQRLYTFVISLAVAESLRKLLINQSGNLEIPGYQNWLIFISFIVTLVPFYHGANRYLDATFVTSERTAKHYALMFDFIALFIEGIAFFVLAMLSNNFEVFYTTLACLFIFDAIWVGSTNLTALTESDKVPEYFKWAFINIVISIVIFVSLWSNMLNWEFWPSMVVKNIALLLAAIGRTLYDYISVWHFYYPKEIEDEGKKYDAIPAPRPAPPPKIV